MLKYISKIGGFAGQVVQYVCWTHVTFEYAGDFVCCSGPSMEPTLHSNNILMTEKISTRRGTVARGDIIIAKNPSNPRQFICKRVIALPGDKVVTQSSVQVNPFASPSHSMASAGTPDPLLASPTTRSIDYEHVEQLDGAPLDTASLTQRMFRSNVVVVPRGHVWLEGDNAGNSLDSRQYGPIPLGLIRSRAVCKLWPPSEICLF